MTSNRILAALVEARAYLHEDDGSEIDEVLEALEEEIIIRKSGGNPYHKGSGADGGQFTTGPSGGTEKPHGKHYAKNQRKKRKKPKRTRRKVAKGYAKGKPPKEKDSARAAKAKASHKPCNKAEKDYAKANEHRFASHIGGKAYPDNAPQDVDVQAKDGNHHLELKSMLSGEHGKINMAKDSIGRKIALSKETGNPFHTVVMDDRDTFAGGASKSLYSGHRLYFKDGVARYNIKDMHPVKNEQEIKKLLDTPYDQWPAKAKAGPSAVAGMKAKR